MVMVIKTHALGKSKDGPLKTLLALGIQNQQNDGTSYRKFGEMEQQRSQE